MIFVNKAFGIHTNSSCFISDEAVLDLNIWLKNEIFFHLPLFEAP